MIWHHLIIRHVPHGPSKPGHLPALVGYWRIKKLAESTISWQCNIRKLETVPVSVRWIEIWWCIRSPKSHVRVIATCTILLHTRNICSLGQNLEWCNEANNKVNIGQSDIEVPKHCIISIWLNYKFVPRVCQTEVLEFNPYIFLKIEFSLYSFDKTS